MRRLMGSGHAEATWFIRIEVKNRGVWWWAPRAIALNHLAQCVLASACMSFCVLICRGKHGIIVVMTECVLDSVYFI